MVTQITGSQPQGICCSRSGGGPIIHIWVKFTEADAVGPETTPEDHGPSDPLFQPLGAFSDKESQSEFKSTLRTECFLFLSSFCSFVCSFVCSFLPFFLPSFLSFFSSYTRVMFALLEAGVPPSLKKDFLSPHSPADRERPQLWPSSVSPGGWAKAPNILAAK